MTYKKIRLKDKDGNKIGDYTDQIQRISDKAFIPFAPGNADYQKYLEWVAAGNTPEASD
jgi:hypothetical protein